MAEGRKDNLITERTYEINQRRLEKWVTTSYNRIDERRVPSDSGSVGRKRRPHQNQEELIRATNDDRERLKQLFIDEKASAHSNNGKPSARSKSWRGGQSGNNKNGYATQYPSQRDMTKSEYEKDYTDRDPYGHQHTVSGNINGSGTVTNYDKAIGSHRDGKSRLVQMINSSRTSSQKKHGKSASDSIQEADGASQQADL